MASAPAAQPHACKSRGGCTLADAQAPSSASRAPVKSWPAVPCAAFMLGMRQAPLAWIGSRALIGGAQAVFDLYFGDQPVSAKAKKVLGTSFLRLGQAGAYQPPQDRLICEASSACAVAYA